MGWEEAGKRSGSRTLSPCGKEKGKEKEKRGSEDVRPAFRLVLFDFVYSA